MAEDLARIAAELYAELPGDFIRVRDARAKALRADGERELATAVKALRRPTTAAWLVNLLAHHPGALAPLIDLGRRLREAQSQLDAPTMKELAAQRPSVVHDLVTEAGRQAKERDPAFHDTPATREQVSATLTAALADPRAEDAVASGQLVTALTYAGFGEVEIGDAIATPLRAVPDPVPARDRSPAARPGSAPEEPVEPAEPAGPTEDELAAARARVAAAAQTLEVAEAGLAQARARRAAARRDWEAAEAALEDLEDREA